MAKLYTKQGSRYHPAEESEILLSAARVLLHLGLDSDASRLEGMAQLKRAFEENETSIAVETRLRAEAEDAALREAEKSFND
ncbi:MAG TPA: hypothetical protein VFI96_06265 [Longimicrobiaceae bacterium]|nr:hypothetical protein [Longimicrobiaceae bacterium]